jgi:hypothetical protein
LPAERDDSHKMIVDSFCSIISAIIVLSAMSFIIFMNGVGIISFTIGWIVLFGLVLILSSILLYKTLLLKTKGLTRVNKGLSYMKDKPSFQRDNFNPNYPNKQYSIQKVSNNSVYKKKNFCPYCGRKMEPDFRFCPFCGN